MKVSLQFRYIEHIVDTGSLDTVPVNADTVDEWTHPPFSGHFDGENHLLHGLHATEGHMQGSLSGAEAV